MLRDVRNLLLVMGLGAILGVVAFPLVNRAGASKIETNAAESVQLSPAQQSAQLQAEQRARVEVSPQQPTTARGLLNKRISDILAHGATAQEVQTLSQILNSDQTAPLNRTLEAALRRGQPLTIRELATLGGNSDPSVSGTYPNSVYQSAYAQGVEATVPQPIQPQSNSLDQPSAAREYLQQQAASAGRERIGSPLIDSPIILNPAGPGSYSDSRGDIYTQAGPHGVVNTRTGEFSPTN